MEICGNGNMWKYGIWSKGNGAFVDLIYGEEDNINHNTFIFAATKG